MVDTLPAMLAPAPALLVFMLLAQDPAPSVAVAAPEDVLRDASSPDDARREAVRRLSTVKGDAGMDALADAALRDPSVQVRFLAVRALERRRGGAEALATVVMVDVDGRVREAAARALGQLGVVGARHENALVHALGDRDAAVRRQAAASLGLVGTRDVLPLLDAPASGKDAVLRSELSRTRKRIQARAAAFDQRSARESERRAFLRAPGSVTPLMSRVLRHGGTPILVLAGAAAGAAAGGLVPVVLVGARGAWLWPVGGALGAAVGAGSGFAYGAVRRFELPVTDGLLVSAHGASGFAAGTGFGLWLGKRSSPGVTAALGLLGGAAATVVSAGASPWMRPRPSMVLGAVSGGALAGTASLLAAGMLGRDPITDPVASLAIMGMGQGVGTILGTLVTAGVPITSVDIVLADVGALLGGAAAAGLVGLTLLVPNGRINGPVVSGALLGGLLAGGAAGVLVGLVLPDTLESRLQAGMTAEGWPFALQPAFPSLDINPFTGKPQGAFIPVVSGTWR